MAARMVVEVLPEAPGQVLFSVHSWDYSLLLLSAIELEPVL